MRCQSRAHRAFSQKWESPKATSMGLTGAISPYKRDSLEGQYITFLPSRRRPEALRDSESFVRVWAAAALARVEPEHPDVIPALVAGTRDGISFVRSLAAWHLGRLGPRHPGIEVALPDLRELLDDNDPSVCAEALVALENLAGKGAPPAELKSLSAH